MAVKEPMFYLLLSDTERETDLLSVPVVNFPGKRMIGQLSSGAHPGTNHVGSR